MSAKGLIGLVDEDEAATQGLEQQEARMTARFSPMNGSAVC